MGCIAVSPQGDRPSYERLTDGIHTSLTFLAALSCLCAAASASAAGLPQCPVQSGQVVGYDIIRDGMVIGAQTVRYGVSGPDLTVEIAVSASIRALGVRVYTYEHHGTEHWHDGQMVGLVTRTDDDGTPRQVNATRDAAGTWHGVSGAAPGPAPLLATSLWNSQTLTATRLLDRETGAVVPVRVTPAGDEVLKLGSRTVTAHKYDLSGLVTGSAWYDSSGCWVRALFHTRVDGSLVEVRAK